jgi:hypothetical protein
MRLSILGTYHRICVLLRTHQFTMMSTGVILKTTNQLFSLAVIYLGRVRRPFVCGPVFLLSAAPPATESGCVHVSHECILTLDSSTIHYMCTSHIIQIATAETESHQQTKSRITPASRLKPFLSILCLRGRSRSRGSRS